MKRASSWILAACFAAGCAEDTEYAGLSFELQSAPPVPVSIESDVIEIPAGIAVMVEATPESSGRSYADNVLLSLRADDEELLGVYATEQDHTFVLVGLREGRSCLEVRVNRSERECIEVRVLPAE